MNFYTIAEAAQAIAVALNPDETERPRVIASWLAAVRDALHDHKLTGRDPVTRLAIDGHGIAFSLRLTSCIISERDLNEWLDKVGVGVRVAPSIGEQSSADELSREADSSPGDRPTSTQLAEALGPYLSGERDSEWLKKRLNDAARYPRLRRFRITEGDHRGARWEVGGVVLHLIEEEFITRDNADIALSAHFPSHKYVLDSLSPQRPQSPAAWFPG